MRSGTLASIVWILISHLFSGVADSLHVVPNTRKILDPHTAGANTLWRKRNDLEHLSFQGHRQRHSTIGKRNDRIILFRGGALAASVSTSPPIGTWITPALLCALSYALYNLSIKKASSSIDHLLGGVFLQIVAAILGTILFVSKSILYGQSASSIVTRKSGIIWSIVAGITVGVAEILSFYVSSRGVQAMQSIPIIVGGSVLFGTLLGRIWLKEIISLRGWIGVTLISAGIILIGGN